MRTIIAGSRYHICPNEVELAISQINWDITTVISGGALGVDTYGEMWASEHNIPIEMFYPDWKTHGKYGGFLRNTEMAKNAEALIAVWDGKSGGTKHMISEAKSMSLLVYVHVVTNKTSETSFF